MATVTATYTASFDANTVSISGSGLSASTVYLVQVLAPGVSTTATVTPQGQALFTGPVAEEAVTTDGAGAFAAIVLPIDSGTGGAGTYNVAVRKPTNAIAATATTTFSASPVL